MMYNNAPSKPPDLIPNTNSHGQVDYLTAARPALITPESLTSIEAEQIFGVLDAVAQLDGLTQTEMLGALQSVISHVPRDQRMAIEQKLVTLGIYNTTYQAHEYLNKCPDPLDTLVFPSKSLADLRALPAKKWL